MAAVRSMKPRWAWLIGSTLVAACTVPNPYLAGESDDGTASDTGGSTTNAATSTGNGSSPTTSDTSGDVSTTSTTGSTPTTDGTKTTSTSTSTSTSTGPEPTCPATHACVDPPPENWSGPVAIATGQIDQQPECGGAFATELAVAFDNLIAATAQCDCDCGAASGMTCDNAVLRWHSTTASCGNSSVNSELAPGCNDIDNRPTNTYWRIQPPGVSGGSCAPIESEQVDPAGFTSVTVACGGPRDMGGCGDDLCILEPTPPFDSSLCVFTEGDFTCPPDYPDKSLTYLDFTDDRGCSNCTCSDPVGTCGGSATLWSTADCTGTLGSGTVVANGNCTQAVGAVSSSNWSPGSPTASCTSVGGDPMGSATPTEPVTFCCTAP